MDIQSKLRFLSLYRMVLADGVVDPQEMTRLREIGRNHYGLSDDAINKILLGNVADMPLIDSNTDRIRLLYEMALIAWADNDLDSRERQLMITYARYFGVEENSIEALVDFLLEGARNNFSLDKIMANFKS